MRKVFHVQRSIIMQYLPFEFVSGLVKLITQRKTKNGIVQTRCKIRTSYCASKIFNRKKEKHS